jgi:sugar lactone lactonase YvrE
MIEVVCAARRENLLGEGVCWDVAAGRVWWVDIKKSLIEWINPQTGEGGSHLVGARPSALAPRGDGTLLVASDLGLAIFDPRSGGMTQRLELEPDRPWNRTNDGGVDSAGRFWVGTMDDTQARRSGALYRLETDWRVTRVLDGLGIPNTLATSPDGRTLYVADSADEILVAYELDPRTGDLGAARAFADTRGQGGTPDGSAMDAEGFLWNAQWGLWRLVRYAPDGRVDRIVELPVEQPTKCAFGGADLRTLYITSAREGLSEESLALQPLAGSLLAFEPGLQGFAPPAFGG